MTDEDIRLHLESEFETHFPDVPTYYRPPGDMILQRPCIHYEALEDQPAYSNNSTFTIGLRYKIMLLSDLPGYSGRRGVYNIAGINVLSNNQFVSDDVVHDVFIITVNAL